MKLPPTQFGPYLTSSVNGVSTRLRTSEIAIETARLIESMRKTSAKNHGTRRCSWTRRCCSEFGRVAGYLGRHTQFIIFSGAFIWRKTKIRRVAGRLTIDGANANNGR